MIDYAQWKRKVAKVSTLLLDRENPRIPPTDQELSQGELLAELIEHDRVYDLAKRIANEGYYADELLIAAPRDGKLVVVEGNRRLAALKALLSPEAAPEQHQRRFRGLSAKVPKSMIRAIPITVAPSRDAALPRIAEKHTRSMLQQWKTPQKARFYQSLLDQGKTADEICESHGLSPSQLDDFVRLGTLYQMACSLNLPTDVQRYVANPRSFPLTNLERLIESQPGRDFLGVETHPKHVFRGRVPAAEFEKGFAKMVADVAKGDVTSRDLNNTEGINKYLRRIEDHRPDKSKKGSFTAKDIVGKPQKSAATTATRQKKTKARRTSTKLVPSDLRCGVDNQRIHDVFNELRRLKVNEFPNATAIMLRVLLELSVSHYLHRLGKTPELLKKFKGGHTRPDWHPTLRQQLDFLLQEIKLPLEPLERKALTQFRSGQHTSFSLVSLDLFVHNMNVQPTERELRAIWAKVEPLLRTVLT